jgi:hypothetical protein
VAFFFIRQLPDYKFPSRHAARIAIDYTGVFPLSRAGNRLSGRRRSSSQSGQDAGPGQKVLPGDSKIPVGISLCRRIAVFYSDF